MNLQLDVSNLESVTSIRILHLHLDIRFLRFTWRNILRLGVSGGRGGTVAFHLFLSCSVLRFIKTLTTCVTFHTSPAHFTPWNNILNKVYFHNILGALWFVIFFYLQNARLTYIYIFKDVSNHFKIPINGVLRKVRAWFKMLHTLIQIFLMSLSISVNHLLLSIIHLAFI